MTGLIWWQMDFTEANLDDVKGLVRYGYLRMLQELQKYTQLCQNTNLASLCTHLQCFFLIDDWMSVFLFHALESCKCTFGIM